VPNELLKLLLLLECAQQFRQQHGLTESCCYAEPVDYEDRTPTVQLYCG